MPPKPQKKTTEYPKTLRDALTYYCNQRTINGLQSCTAALSDANWPLPFWFNHDNVKVGFWNKLYYKRQYNSWDKKRKFKGFKGYDFFWVPTMVNMAYKRPFDEILVEAFDANFKYAFQKLFANPVLHSKKAIIKSVEKNYKERDWIACISSLFPLLDFVTRKMLKTNKLSIDVLKICKLFEHDGFSILNANNFMLQNAFLTSWDKQGPLFTEERTAWFKRMEEYDFGLIGPALSSFIRFANIYYSYYKEDREENEEIISSLNRHAILHGSINHFGTKINTVKLLTFLHLTLELEVIFEILFAE